MLEAMATSEVYRIRSSGQRLGATSKWTGLRGPVLFPCLVVDDKEVKIGWLAIA